MSRCQVHTSLESTHTCFYGVLLGPDMPSRYVQSSLPTPLLSLSSHFEIKQLTQARAAIVSTSPSLVLCVSASLRAGNRIPRARGLKDGR